MNDSRTIQIEDLLLRWQEEHDRGRALSAEELCCDCPDLLPEVSRRLADLQAMFRVLDSQPARAPTQGAPNQTGPVAPLAVPGYELLGELGRGGMGVVYKARQVGLKRLVAVKMLRGGQVGPDERARFRREAEAVARLQHANIVQVYEVGEHDGQPFFALELIEGGNLAEKLAGAPQPPAAAAQLVATLARAIHLAHERGIVHRDLKPANVLLGADGTPKITDFGLAKCLQGAGEQTQSGAILGTPSYMAPEQASGQSKNISAAADIYGLGAMLYEMLTGKPPFQGKTPWEVVVRVLSDEPVPPRRLQPKVPHDLETICLKCLHKAPARRYASAADLADDLERFLAGRSWRARRPAGNGPSSGRGAARCWRLPWPGAYCCRFCWPGWRWPTGTAIIG